MNEASATLAQTGQKELLIQRCADHIVGMLDCWDQVVITGALTDVCHASAVEAWLRRDEIRCFDLKVFAEPLRNQVRDHAILTARAAGLTVEHLERATSAKKIAPPRSCAGTGRHRAWCMFFW